MVVLVPSPLDISSPEAGCNFAGIIFMSGAGSRSAKEVPVPKMVKTAARRIGFITMGRTSHTFVKVSHEESVRFVKFR
jgi:hypothetical protein